MERYSVRLTKDELVFSASHFITYDRDACERLHGHNYRVTAEVQGPLDENHYVVDFTVLRETLRQIVGELDHRMLVPTGHAQLEVDADQREVVVRFRNRRWVFPRSDCVLLPLANTTSELLARYIGQRLLMALAGEGGMRPDRVRIEVDEGFGQAAVCELRDN